MEDTAFSPWSPPPHSTIEDRMREALIWMTGSDDFSPGGKAHEGFEKIVRPVLDELYKRKEL